jgi:hypothetical protein
MASRPAAVEGESGPREILCLTVSADHELIDRAPLARFVRHLRGLLEAADGLPGADAPSQAEAPAGGWRLHAGEAPVDQR